MILSNTARWLPEGAELDLLTVAATALTLSLAICVALHDARMLIG